MITLSKFPNLVISLYLSGSIVSREILIRLTPAALSAGAYLSNCAPLVVKFSSSSPGNAPNFSISDITSLRTIGSPPVNRIFLTPNSIKALATK